jgi:hypothetical protein
MVETAPWSSGFLKVGQRFESKIKRRKSSGTYGRAGLEEYLNWLASWHAMPKQ